MQFANVTEAYSIESNPIVAINHIIQTCQNIYSIDSTSWATVNTVYFQMFAKWFSSNESNVEKVHEYILTQRELLPICCEHRLNYLTSFL